jgi:hypothetical protein
MRVSSNRMSEESRGNSALPRLGTRFICVRLDARSGTATLRSSRRIVYCRANENFGVGITPRFKAVIQRSGK